MQGSDAKYGILINILDGVIKDGAAEGARAIYRDAAQSPDARDQARARAYIHLFLEANYGIYDFQDRERQITDSSYDGGIDAYHIDTIERVVVLVQSKFRTNASNFSEKAISANEVSRVDAERILRGETEDAQGNAYSGHIKGLQRELASLSDIARYRFKVVLLANVRDQDKPVIAKLLSDFETEIYDFQRCYKELVVPMLRGEQTYFPDLHFNIDMSNKSAGSRLSAAISTEHGPVEVTVILVPTIEIARFMARYRNSILRYNPRSYLELSHQSTNRQIRDSITERKTGEFALFNNGITILSDETFVSERVGQKDAAQVTLRNPQIINGGQTAYTLSRIYDESSDIERATLFEDKEVVVRIITLPDLEAEAKFRLIQEISSATNSQTQVSAVDREVVNDEQRALAERIFLEHGILYEHKRGEYSEAVRKGFISRGTIVERSTFLRLMLVAEGKFNEATRAKSVKKGAGFRRLEASDATIARFGTVHAIYRIVARNSPPAQRRLPERLAFVETVLVAVEKELIAGERDFAVYVDRVAEIWPSLVDWSLGRHKMRQQVGTTRSETGRQAINWARNHNCPTDIRGYLRAFGLGLPYTVRNGAEAASAPDRAAG